MAVAEGAARNCPASTRERLARESIGAERKAAWRRTISVSSVTAEKRNSGQTRRYLAYPRGTDKMAPGTAECLNEIFRLLCEQREVLNHWPLTHEQIAKDKEISSRVRALIDQICNREQSAKSMPSD
jgi:hypothetical protein